MNGRLKNFIVREWSLEEKALVSISLMSIGIILGFLVSPVKKGIKLGCGNGSYNGSNNETFGNELSSKKELKDKCRK